jgi:hypothetical protein
MNDSSMFRDKLLAAEPVSPAVRDQIQQEIQNMLVKKLSTPKRVFMTVVAIADFAAAVLCGSLVITEAQLPPLARIGLGVGSLFGIAWGAWFVRLLRRGEMNIRDDARWMARMVWCFTLAMVIFMVIVGMTAKDPMKGVLMILQSFVFLIGAAVYWLTHRIEDAELNVTERLLRMELQMAEMRERR